MVLELREPDSCRYDAVSLGEVMLRLDPGEERIHTARTFRAWEGGGEYNVARGLRRCFGLRTAIVTALADNAVGRLIEDFILQGGVDTSFIHWVPHDGLGRTVRNGLNFTERGHGLRGALGVSDRGRSAASQLRPGDIDFDRIFGELGARWLHTGGIYAALSNTTAEVVIEAITAARRNGTIVSYDLNYRPSLWDSIGGPTRAQEVNLEIVQHVDVLLGNEEDFSACLGFEVPEASPDNAELDVRAFESMLSTVGQTLTRLQVAATTLRSVRTATRNDWGAIAWSRDGGFVEATYRPDVEILDRVGGGDSFASGLVYGLLSGEKLATAVEYGAAHGVLAMTTPGDNSMASIDEVRDLAGGGNARVKR